MCISAKSIVTILVRDLLWAPMWRFPQFWSNNEMIGLDHGVGHLV